MVLTDGKNRLKIDEENIFLVDDNYVVGLDDSVWCFELFFEKEENENRYKRVVKRLPSGGRMGGDELKSYKIIENSNINEIMLSKTDFEEIKRLYNNMKNVYKYRSKSIIEAIAILLAYECYENYYLQELWEVDDNGLFEDIIEEIPYQRDCILLKDEIYKRTKEILKEQYQVNLDKIIGGGNM